MEIKDILQWMGILILVGGLVWALCIIIPEIYQSIHSYRIMASECKANPDICFCSFGECTIKSSCSYSKINDGPIMGGCNYTRLCTIFTKADWREGLWDYDCGVQPKHL